MLNIAENAITTRILRASCALHSLERAYKEAYLQGDLTALFFAARIEDVQALLTSLNNGLTLVRG